MDRGIQKGCKEMKGKVEVIEQRRIRGYIEESR
jgi:hypothetical protein